MAAATSVCALLLLSVAVAEPQYSLPDGYLPPLPGGYLPPPPGSYLPPSGEFRPSGSGAGVGLPLPPPPPPPRQQTTLPKPQPRPEPKPQPKPQPRPVKQVQKQPPATSSQPMKTIFFEKEHYMNKATEQGFCSTFCGSIRNEIVRKPGRCPAIQPGPQRGLCKDECTYDSECPRSQRCCNNGCANVCVEPDFRQTCADLQCGPGTECVDHPVLDAECVSTTPKGGYCPKYMNDSRPIGGCEDMCKFDSQCDGDAKCCFNGCAYKCLKPRKPGCAETKCKVGFKCEEDRYGNPQCKPIPCEQDGEVIDIECNSCTCIQGFLLCAQEECPPVKPGFCPRIVKGYKGRCVEECSSDYDCEGETKCCSTGCGHTCQKPGKAIVHPCKTVRFRCGDDTRCAATRGLCQPGKPCPLSPLCVSNRVPYCESCPEGKVCVLQKKACFGAGRCHRQPICIQLYSDDTPFEENEDLEVAVVAKQQAARSRNTFFP
ncbi:latent-transforming growth factor beta-binding protein 4-like [Amphibalanus amphitrite]|uniref:latent-transforming growth factor beta-binding protein 4-like n=1 Tax=Amphibalanus amphitrite TaxID=1232801 RepID=UPI001C92004D|nr:latent-transforming growth factor beta-binding protein 4-like [Amphibalanus amphitrite]